MPKIRFCFAISYFLIVMVMATGCLSRPKLTEQQILAESLGSGITLGEIMSTNLATFHPSGAIKLNYKALGGGTESVDYYLQKYGEAYYFGIIKSVDSTPGKSGTLVTLNVIQSPKGIATSSPPGLKEGLVLGSPDTKVKEICGKTLSLGDKTGRVYAYMWSNAVMSVTTAGGKVDTISVTYKTGKADFSEARNAIQNSSH
jgi:hypothetical protein